MHPKFAAAKFERDLAGVNDELCQARRWIVVTREFPLLDIIFDADNRPPLRLRLDCARWNQVPPKIELLTKGGEPIIAGTNIPSSTAIFHAGPHPATGLPFVCMKGVYEYHIHDSHRTDPWDALRPLAGYRLGEIVTQIWNGWRHANL